MTDCLIICCMEILRKQEIIYNHLIYLKSWMLIFYRSRLLKKVPVMTGSELFTVLLISLVPSSPESVSPLSRRNIISSRGEWSHGVPQANRRRVCFLCFAGGPLQVSVLGVSPGLCVFLVPLEAK